MLLIPKGWLSLHMHWSENDKTRFPFFQQVNKL